MSTTALKKPPEQNTCSVLVVEDEVDILNLMCLHLEREGYQVDRAETGPLAYDKLSSASSCQYHLIILDWMIPEISGLKLLKWIRQKDHTYKNTPVLFVTAKSGPKDIVYGLENGADDYITKPFDLSVFKARVKNLIKRSTLMDSSDNELILKSGDLKLNTDTHKVFIMERELVLTFSEFRLLEILLRNQGKALSRKKIISFIQGEDINVTGRTIDTHIAIIRKKMGTHGKHIETVRGIGYRIGFI